MEIVAFEHMNKSAETENYINTYRNTEFHAYFPFSLISPIIISPTRIHKITNKSLISNKAGCLQKTYSTPREDIVDI